MATRTAKATSRQGWKFHSYDNEGLDAYDTEARRQFKGWWKKRVKEFGTLAAGSESSAEAAWRACARTFV
jgi:hypothetical protein